MQYVDTQLSVILFICAFKCDKVVTIRQQQGCATISQQDSYDVTAKMGIIDSCFTAMFCK